MEGGNKIGYGELLVFSFLFLFVDIICFLIDFTVVGAGITPVIQGFVLFFMDKFLMGKGTKSASKLGRKIAKYALQLLPLLPTLVTTFLIEAAIHNKQNSIPIASKSVPSVVGVATKSVVS